MEVSGQLGALALPLRKEPLVPILWEAVCAQSTSGHF